MKNLIGISGKAGHGKDTVGIILQCALQGVSEKDALDYVKIVEESGRFLDPNYQIKKFADKLKDIVCLLIGCTRAQLEDQEFKETPLDSSWDVFKIYSPRLKSYFPEISMDPSYLETVIKTTYRSVEDVLYVERVNLTPRILLQVLGTDCGRELIHPNIWVNALFSDYVEESGFKYTVVPDSDQDFSVNDVPDKMKMKVLTDPVPVSLGFPKWIITDVRFPNEFEAIRKRNGHLIRVERLKVCTCGIPATEHFNFDKAGNPVSNKYRHFYCEQVPEGSHKSETALDSYSTEFDTIIYNNGSLEDLVRKIYLIL